MSDLNELVKRYLESWNEADGDARRRAIAEIWTEDAVYTDPMASVQGHEGINAVIEGAQGMFPGHVIRLLNTVDAHHNIARFSWEMVPQAGGESIVVGFDVAVTGDDGRLRAVYGFLDKVPTG